MFIFQHRKTRSDPNGADPNGAIRATRSLTAHFPSAVNPSRAEEDRLRYPSALNKQFSVRSSRLQFQSLLESQMSPQPSWDAVNSACMDFLEGTAASKTSRPPFGLTLEISCEAPICSCFVSFISLLGGSVDPPAHPACLLQPCHVLGVFCGVLDAGRAGESGPGCTNVGSTPPPPSSISSESRRLLRSVSKRSCPSSIPRAILRPARSIGRPYRNSRVPGAHTKAA